MMFHSFFLELVLKLPNDFQLLRKSEALARVSYSRWDWLPVTNPVYWLLRRKCIVKTNLFGGCSSLLRNTFGSLKSLQLQRVQKVLSLIWNFNSPHTRPLLIISECRFCAPNHTVNHWCASKLRFSGRPSLKMANESSTERKALRTSHHHRGMQDFSVKTRDRASLELSFWQEALGESPLPLCLNTCPLECLWDLYIL
jgi:hypothetical protein